MGNKISCLDCNKSDIKNIEINFNSQTPEDYGSEDTKYNNSHIKSAKIIQNKYRKLKCYNKLLQNLFLLIENKMKSIEVLSIDDLKERISENKLKILNNFEAEIKLLKKTKSSIIRVNLGTMLFNEQKEYYLGEWNLKGQKAGLGILITEDNSVYFGFFENDLFHGQGIFINDDGYYYGEWKFGKIWGKGTLKFHDAKINYTGYWVDNQRDGYGEEIFEDGSHYKGNFKKNERDGDGIYIWSDGTQYKGNFKNSLIEGKGTINYVDGRSYQGFWKENKFHGYGIHKWGNGNYYDGCYSLGVKNGDGVYCWSNDCYYNGQWLNNFLHGEGTLNIKNRNHNGIWRYGKLIRMIELNNNIEGNLNYLSDKNDTLFDSPSNTYDDKNNLKSDLISF